MTDRSLSARLEAIEAGYEYALAYAAQGRTDDTGTPMRETLERMHAALENLLPLVEAEVLRREAAHAASTRHFIDAVGRDASTARGAIGLVLDQRVISSLLVDNLNASIHLRALLTDLFLVDQARKTATASSPSR
jgi:hypothetical protein